MERTLAVVVAALVALVACRHGDSGRPIPTGRSEAVAREVLHRFATAVQERRWPEAYALLSDRWRAAYTPARLASDHEGAGTVGRDAAERVLALLAAGTPLVGDPGSGHPEPGATLQPRAKSRDGARLSLPVGGGRAAVLVAEAGGWRVDALE
jgi:hypothetical protein